MDCQKILSDKIDALPQGDHTNGLKAVRLHIESAVRHYQRGVAEKDETIFTDAIYRCNQAYEGSLKEAYRVLAGKIPDRHTPSQIEDFLTEGNILRRRLLDQLTRYRTEWRNPSTHNHMLDFDEDEALLAIGSVTALAIVLCDQIDGMLAFNAAEASAASRMIASPRSGQLIDQIAEKVAEYCTLIAEQPGASMTSSHFEGGLAGFLQSTFEKRDIAVQLGGRDPRALVSPDILLQAGKEKFVLELKGVSGSSPKSAIERGRMQLRVVSELAKATGAVLVICSPTAKLYSIQDSNEDIPTKIVLPSTEPSETISRGPAKRT